MYWFPPDEALKFRSGFDIRCARLHMLGLDLYSSYKKISPPTVDSSHNLLESLMGSLQIARGVELFDREFVNVMHVLQVVQFYCWKWSTLKATEVKQVSQNIKPLSQVQQEDIKCLKSVVLQDLQQAETFSKDLNCGKKVQYLFDWGSFSAAVVQWEAYSCNLHKEMVMSIPLWRKHGSIFPCSVGDSAVTL